jgi:hypothetical protein
MNPANKNRLKDAMQSVAVPEGLKDRIRSRIQEMPVRDARLRAAVDSVEVPPFLESRIRARLDAETAGRRWARIPQLVTVATAAVVLLGVLIAYQLGHLRLTVSSQESYVASVSNQIATLMRVGLGDHIHCTVFRKYPKTPLSTEEVIAKMPAEYAPLIPIVREQVSETYHMTLAHQCRYHGRKFIHLSLMDGSKMLSLVITRKGAGESFRTEDMMPALVQSGIPMYQSSVQRFEMTAFETRDHLIYFISDLPKDQNTNLMMAMAPRVKNALGKLEF